MIPELVEFEGIRGETQKDADALISTANDLVVSNQEQMHGATAFLKSVMDARNKVKERFDPIIKKFHEGHKMALSLRNEITHPFDLAEKVAKTKIQAFINEQEAIRIAQEEKLAEQTKDSGLPPPILPSMPTPQGIHGRKNLKIRVVDMKKLCASIAKGKAPAETVTVDETFIRNLVKKRGIENLNLPGVEAYYEKGLVVKS